MERKDVKFQPGEYYCKYDWDRTITIVCVIPGAALVQGLLLSTEPIHVDKDGNEYLELHDGIYPAYYRNK